MTLLVFIFQVSNISSAQVDTFTCRKGRVDMGLELQAYPAGFIPTLTTNLFFKYGYALRLRLGTNLANRRNMSPYNDWETAKGYGSSLGLVTYHPYKSGHFTAGATVDAWSMVTDWKDNLNTSFPTSGSTRTLVVQPWLDVGYLWHINHSHWNLGSTLGFGREINVITDGDPVGQGWMGSVTFTMNYTVKR